MGCHWGFYSQEWVFYFKDLAVNKSWLGWQDSNLRMAASKAAALPLGDTPIAKDRMLPGRAGERAYYPVCPQGARGSYI